MIQRAKLVCINPKCGKAYPIRSTAIKCEACSFLLDVKYEDNPNPNLKEIFYEVATLKDEFKNAGDNEDIQIELSYLEVYNEKIYDLLNPGTKKSLEPREDTKKGIVIVAGLEQRIVNNEKDVMDAVKLGNHNRKMSATAANLGMCSKVTKNRILFKYAGNKQVFKKCQK